MPFVSRWRSFPRRHSPVHFLRPEKSASTVRKYNGSISGPTIRWSDGSVLPTESTHRTPRIWSTFLRALHRLSPVGGHDHDGPPHIARSSPRHCRPEDNRTPPPAGGSRSKPERFTRATE